MVFLPMIFVLFGSSVLSMIAYKKPCYSVVLITLVFSLLSSLLSVLSFYWSVTFFLSPYRRDYITWIDFLLQFIYLAEAILSLVSFFMCCQSLFCGVQGTIEISGPGPGHQGHPTWILK